MFSAKDKNKFNFFEINMFSNVMPVLLIEVFVHFHNIFSKTRTMFPELLV
jgi:hypothetical protein